MLKDLLSNFSIATRRGFVTLTSALEINKAIKDGEGVAWLKEGVDLAAARKVASDMSAKTGHHWVVLDPVPATPTTRAKNARIQVGMDVSALEY